MEDIKDSITALAGLSGRAEKFLYEMRESATSCGEALEQGTLNNVEDVLPVLINFKVLSIMAERNFNAIKQKIEQLEKELIKQRLDELIPCATLPRLHDESKPKNDLEDKTK